MSVNVSIASKITEIGRNSVVMYVSDQLIDGKLQLTVLLQLYASLTQLWSYEHILNAFVTDTFISKGTQAWQLCSYTFYAVLNGAFLT